jgi:predicted short-subunit dehydrogenase-like oxidoreductase (DUF2520 family)
VYGRNRSHAKALSEKLKTDFTTDIKKISAGADVYLIAMTDSSIETFSKKLVLKKELIAHTSGSVSMEVFKKNFLNYGVFYPLQTITKNSAVNFRSTPICIEATNIDAQQKLMKLAQSLSDTVFVINSEERKIMHLAAVFVSNFTNHLFHIGETILKDNNLSFNLLKPLIAETINKLKNQTPAESQTGPAARNDKVIIERQLKMLKKYPAFKNIYKDITESIQQIKK